MKQRYTHDSRPYAEKLIEPLRAKAKELGYALAVHGTLKRDIDLVAIPWTREAVYARDLAEAIRAEAEKVVGFAQMHYLEKSCERNAFNEFHDYGCPGWKPHNRFGFCFHLVPTYDGPYIDLAVMPRVKEEDEYPPLLTEYLKLEGLTPKSVDSLAEQK